MDNITKPELRTKFKNIRNNIQTSCKGLKDESIRNTFNNLFADRYDTFFIYKSFSGEVSTEGIIEDLFNKEKKVLIPKCNLETETMNAVEIFRSDSFKLNTYGIPEITTDDFYEDRIDIIVMPGLVFDKKGNRIGYGKGYYDKYINLLNYKPILVGLAYDEQIIDSIDATDEYDAKLDYVITDSHIYEF